MELIENPRVVYRPAMHYLGIGLITPFRGMLSARDSLMNELSGWLLRNDVAGIGRFFFRLLVIDMRGPMEIEIGVVTANPAAGDGRVHPGLLPAGHYATLTYRDHARRANGALIDWASANGVDLDRSADPNGDRFACRYESYVTDPRSEPRKTKWQVELNIRVIEPA